jgi:hypothetical protein
MFQLATCLEQTNATNIKKFPDLGFERCLNSIWPLVYSVLNCLSHDRMLSASYRGSGMMTPPLLIGYERSHRLPSSLSCRTY